MYIYLARGDEYPLITDSSLFPMGVPGNDPSYLCTNDWLLVIHHAYSANTAEPVGTAAVQREARVLCVPCLWYRISRAGGACCLCQTMRK